MKKDECKKQAQLVAMHWNARERVKKGFRLASEATWMRTYEGRKEGAQTRGGKTLREKLPSDSSAQSTLPSKKSILVAKVAYKSVAFFFSRVTRLGKYGL